MHERSDSGMNIREFCKHIGICENTYFYWQRRVREAAVERISRSEMSAPRSDVQSGDVTCASLGGVYANEGGVFTEQITAIDKAAIKAGHRNVHKSEASQQALVPSGWAQVSVTQGPQKVAGSPLSIEIGSCRIIVDADTDLELLAKTCRMLVSLC